MFKKGFDGGPPWHPYAADICISFFLEFFLAGSLTRAIITADKDAGKHCSFIPFLGPKPCTRDNTQPRKQHPDASLGITRAQLRALLKPPRPSQHCITLSGLWDIPLLTHLCRKTFYSPLQRV